MLLLKVKKAPDGSSKRHDYKKPIKNIKGDIEGCRLPSFINAPFNDTFINISYYLTISVNFQNRWMVAYTVEYADGLEVYENHWEEDADLDICLNNMYVFLQKQGVL